MWVRCPPLQPTHKHKSSLTVRMWSFSLDDWTCGGGARECVKSFIFKSTHLNSSSKRETTGLFWGFCSIKSTTKRIQHKDNPAGRCCSAGLHVWAHSQFRWLLSGWPVVRHEPSGGLQHHKQQNKPAVSQKGNHGWTEQPTSALAATEEDLATRLWQTIKTWSERMDQQTSICCPICCSLHCSSEQNLFLSSQIWHWGHAHNAPSATSPALLSFVNLF